MLDKFNTLWKFARPHTVIGTSISLLGLYLLALGAIWRTQVFWLTVPTLLWALAACLAANVYIVGLNQLEDVAIDQVNKPHLPLASGELSRTEGRVIVFLTGVTAVAIATAYWPESPFLLVTVVLSLLIGTAYSLPPIRLKRFPLPASLCIFTVRGLVVNIGLFAHFDQVINGVPSRIQLNLSPELWALSLFVLVMTLVVAIFKDIPDIEGDRKYNISTFTLRLGAKTIFNLSRWLLVACYGLMALFGWLLPNANPQVLITSHLLALGFMLFESLRVNLADPKTIADFYQFIWRLFYIEYLIFPLACLLR
ncbi:homogentisate phytyltransferase [Leptolyngbya sp. FACHB-261]|uniref:homogentisate phytyltransferase n=1 Tax=Leptolyngbya sp. FACHB-261 TaxID=2692806 RepID=UPI0016829920|nr:homogentisate phytyltransferase [Leptolyngbya sp. FACHB-261]MBD2102070.1 homogentisate phytyltransferase [Leptolyngbya sp. FACHB-261]